ncbi:aromatic ring-hydroxylating oxygenase subunit alpha [Streptomyces virginiae]|uniref:aromatic ring-hydroxylating oxygenase subunit alpha n=1 Tax=Streptomyces virginiae TaxID=1961 RepID=UPI0004C577FF|nr:aromatic ring-hydroxylating dioxygenase subunit alpha [Streptomyces virginiae]
MKEHTQQALIERILKHIENRTTDCAAEERTVPTDDYLGDEHLKREMEAVFQRRPVLLAHSSQLAKPGDFVTEDLYGRSVLAVRTRRGKVRAFLNVCRHRGAKLVDAGHGTAGNGFSCRTHAWRYDDEGTLTHVPDQARCFSPLTLAERNLFQVPAQESHGFVWVGPPQAGPEVLTGHLDALDEDFNGYRFADDTFWAGERLTGRFNWKLGVEGFLEVYHFRSLHPDMKKYVFVPEVALFDRLGEHVRIVAPKRDIRELRSAPASARRLRPHATLVYYIFPSTFFFVEKRHVTTLRIQPLSPDSSEIRVLHVARQDGLVRPDTLRTNISLFTKVLGEDVGAAESVQGGLVTAPQELLFGRNEAGLHYFRDTLLRVLEQDEHPPT